MAKDKAKDEAQALRAVRLAGCSKAKTFDEADEAYKKAGNLLKAMKNPGKN